ncbi:hypothetical protein [Spirosoma flavum]|uniref:Uncharacterized protein n=1 Tax=Spirosoma flavum TaxID=2048557 RepID=A0ABW6AU94_9BACT
MVKLRKQLVATTKAGHRAVPRWDAAIQAGPNINRMAAANRRRSDRSIKR